MGRPAPTPISTVPTCFSSSARIWPTAIRSCSCGWPTGCGPGAKLIVVDPRRTATADKADLFLQIRPGTDLALLNGLLHLLVASGDIDTDFIAEHTEGWDAMGEFLADYPPARVAELTGLAEADIRTAATMIAEADEWMSLWTMGLNQSTHGTWNTNAICNLHLATGAICRPGSGPMSLTGQPNAMGGREMGYMGPGLPGQRSVAAADDRAFVEAVWELAPGTIRTDTNRGTIDMFEQMAAGDIKACWIICTNPVATRTQPHHRHHRPGDRGAGRSPRTPTATPPPTATPTSCCPRRCGPKPTG